MVKELKNNIWFQLKDFLFIILGSFSYALAWQGFLIPNQLTTGAVTGLASIIYYAFGTPPVDVTYAVANVILLIFALKILGLKFCIRTIFGVFFCWLFLHVLPLWIPNGLVQGDTFMASVIGGILCGIGLGVVFTSNGSTGGTDIIAAMVNKYRNVSFGKMLLYIDIIIISSSYLVFHDVQRVIYGYIIMFITTTVCDMIINGIRASVQLLIFSDKWEDIAESISNELQRGVTVLDGMGWYTKKPKKVLVVVAKRTQITQIERLIKNIDNNAFISQSAVSAVYGQGFDKIKS
ncbi:MAG: YitT family protein [Bacteroidaceae bacterium]|nr:YitT family protein [Bacteroidaceae bacterium]MBQ6939654.1 YitT family protein [Muribaculaceae bacterium]